MLRHGDSVLRQATYLLQRREDAEDVLQETFLSVLRHAEQFRAEASARTWLLKIARNAALRRVSRSPYLEASLDDMPELEVLAAQAGWGRPDPETLAMLAEDRARLHEALEGLLAGDREVLLLREWDGLRGEEIAELLGLTLPAVKSRLHRARLHLAARLRTSSSRAPNQAQRSRA